MYRLFVVKCVWNFACVKCTVFPAIFLENATSSLSAPAALSEIINAH